MVLSPHRPFRFLVVGNGRLAAHLKHYFTLLDLPFGEWNRHLDVSLLGPELERSSHVLLAISDSAISAFYQIHLPNFSGRIVHFSGAMDVPPVLGAHPLMSFRRELYPDDFYKKIPFVLSHSLPLNEVLPGLPNPAFHIHPEDKAKYHALCVLGGNLTTMLLQKMLSGFKAMGLPKEIAEPYIQRVLQNVFDNPETALTGPLARKDLNTIAKNLQSLSGDPFAEVYKAFLTIALKTPTSKSNLNEESQL